MQTGKPNHKERGHILKKYQTSHGTITLENVLDIAGAISKDLEKLSAKITAYNPPAYKSFLQWLFDGLFFRGWNVQK